MKRILILLLCFSFFVPLISCEYFPFLNEEEPEKTVVNITVENGFGSGTYATGSVVTASTTVDNFTGWKVNGVIVSSEKTYQFIARADMTLTATYEEPTQDDKQEYLTKFKDVVKQTTDLCCYSVNNSDTVARTTAKPTTLNSKVSFSSAANESETAVLELNALRNCNLTLNDIKFTNLYINDDVYIKSSCIESYVELYIDVTSNWSETDKQRTADYPNGVDHPALGEYPDGLLPLKAARYTDYKYFNLNKNENQGLFFIINVPKNAQKGLYKGQVEISFTNSTTLVLPVELNVFGFNLPDENAYKYIINIDVTEQQALYPGTDKKSIYYTEAFELLASKGISGFLPGSAWGSNTIDDYINVLKKAAVDNRIPVYELSAHYEGGITVNYSYKEKGTKKTGTLTNTNILVAETVHYPTYDVYGYKDIFRILVENSTNELDLLKKAVLYFPQADEPSKLNDYVQNILCENVVNSCKDYVLQTCNFTGKEKVKESLQNLKYIVTCDVNDTLYKGLTDFTVTSYSGSENCLLNNIKYKTVTGYVPLYTKFMPTATNKANIDAALADPNCAVWWYGCIMPVNPYASIITNANLTIKRCNAWQAYGIGVVGELFYMANRTTDYLNYTPSSNTEAQVFANGINYEGASNDGLLIYPCYNVLEDYNSITTKPLYFISSVRLENISESIDDYNYLVYAQSLIDGLTNQTNKTKYQTELDTTINSLYTNPATNTNDSTKLANARLKIAQLIENLLKLH